MTKLEEKLIQLGYVRSSYAYDCIDFIKIYKDTHNLIVETNGYAEYIYNAYVDLDGKAIFNQQDIDNLQQAFNQLQNDLEVLKDE